MLNILLFFVELVGILILLLVVSYYYYRVGGDLYGFLKRKAT